MGHNDCLDQTKKDFQQMTSHARPGLIAAFMAEHCPFSSLDPFDASIYIYMFAHTILLQKR